MPEETICTLSAGCIYKAVENVVETIRQNRGLCFSIASAHEGSVLRKKIDNIDYTISVIYKWMDIKNYRKAIIYVRLLYKEIDSLMNNWQKF